MAISVCVICGQEYDMVTQFAACPHAGKPNPDQGDWSGYIREVVPLPPGRQEIAMRVMAGFAANTVAWLPDANSPAKEAREIAELAVLWADMLIEELNKG